MRRAIVILAMLAAIGLPAGVAGADSTVTVFFTPGTLPFPDGYEVTVEYSAQGIVFSGQDNDLPPAFQTNFGGTASLIQSSNFYNPFRVNFIASEPVVSVSVRLGDSNGNPQTHTLTAFDSAKNIVDSDSFAEPGDGGTFTLTVSSPAGIAFVVDTEQPFGAEMLERITYTTATRVIPDTRLAFQDNRINRFDIAAPVAIYAAGYGAEGVGLHIYQIASDSSGTLVLEVTPAMIAAAGDPPAEFTLIAAFPDNSLQVFRLPTGQFQINAATSDGKLYVIVFDDLYAGTPYTSDTR